MSGISNPAPRDSSISSPLSLHRAALAMAISALLAALTRLLQLLLWFVFTFAVAQEINVSSKNPVPEQPTAPGKGDLI